MQGVYWSFGDKSYDSFDQFVSDVKEYNQTINAANPWNPEREVDGSSKLRVWFEAMWKDDDDVFDITVEGREGKPVTDADVLFGIQNGTIKFFEGADAIFFEGLTKTKDADDGTPVYEVWIGS